MEMKLKLLWKVAFGVAGCMHCCIWALGLAYASICSCICKRSMITI
jgi:hypothetical protein